MLELTSFPILYGCVEVSRESTHSNTHADTTLRCVVGTGV